MTDQTRAPEYRENLAQIAEALMDTTSRNCPGWHPMDCPSEIVVDLVNERDELKAEVARLTALLNTPETEEFLKALPLEAAHQVERWGSDNGAGKTAWDWFWLIGYLAQKAATSAIAGDLQKARHHTISTAAALANWHKALAGGDNKMRPGVMPPAVS